MYADLSNRICKVPSPDTMVDTFVESSVTKIIVASGIFQTTLRITLREFQILYSEDLSSPIKTVDTFAYDVATYFAYRRIVKRVIYLRHGCSVRRWWMTLPQRACLKASKKQELVLLIYSGLLSFVPVQRRKLDTRPHCGSTSSIDTSELIFEFDRRVVLLFSFLGLELHLSSRLDCRRN